MVGSSGAGGGGVGKAAIEAALKRMQAQSAQLDGSQTGAPQESHSFADVVKNGIQEVEASVQRSADLPLEVVKGNLDFHEVAAQLKHSELSFQFAMQVRNKFVDAYREVMRMSV